MRPLLTVLLTAVLVLCSTAGLPADESQLILAHYLPWYETDAAGQHWGWHWTMNAFNPAEVRDGRRTIASHLYPAIGPYDSGDDAVLEYHLLLMKLSGIDGVIVDWYCLENFRDYPLLHKNTQRLVGGLQRFGLKFAICYEDQTVAHLVNAQRLAPAEKTLHVSREIEWMADNWFGLPGYVRLDERPVLLSFGQTGLSDDEWTDCLARSPKPLAYFSEHRRRPGASGAFDWPIPNEGVAAAQRFLRQTPAESEFIPAAYPRFLDIYAEAKVHAGYGRIADADGATFRATLEQALQSRARVVQLVTWNDWGEGTSVEPSLEYGTRDLAVIQELRRQYVDPQFPSTPRDLQLPGRLFRLRQAALSEAQHRELDRIAELTAKGSTADAEAALQACETR